MNPQYDWKNPKHKVIGYQVTTSVNLKLKDFSKIGPVTAQLADVSVADSQSLSYTLDSTEEAKSKAVADAYRRARASAQALANASGRTLGELSYASVDTFKIFACAHPWCANPWRRWQLQPRPTSLSHRM